MLCCLAAFCFTGGIVDPLAVKRNDAVRACRQVICHMERQIDNIDLLRLVFGRAERDINFPVLRIDLDRAVFGGASLRRFQLDSRCIIIEDCFKGRDVGILRNIDRCREILILCRLKIRVRQGCGHSGVSSRGAECRHRKRRCYRTYH